MSQQDFSFLLAANPNIAMKFLILSFVLPYVIGQCPDPPAEPVTCKGSELLCGGELDAKGCQMPDFCMPINSGYCPVFRPVTCGPNEI